MKRRTILKGLAGALPSLWLSPSNLAAQFNQLDGGVGEPMASGPFKPNWNSLQQYAVPDWYRDAKFGIWAHWGPQCEPEYGDWYAREMYMEGSKCYQYHVEKYGHPSQFGFKDVIHRWKAESWNPDQLLELYKRAGAQYFVALANHHDNFDNYNSKYQRWNATQYGPRKDLIGGWAAAARKQGLPFGVSVHAAHAWSWYEPAQKADLKGPLAGVPYDGKLKKEDGKGTWWEGLDPQELYQQQHALSATPDVGKMWNWNADAGCVIPTQAYCEQFYNRTVDLINQYHPELVYFDDTVLPLWPISNVGLRIAAHLYNSNIRRNNGQLRAVLNGKILNEAQRKCMVWDIERGQSNRIEPFVWQTDTCIGSWHYNRPLYEQRKYKSPQTVIHTLVDVVSKNGNLLLSIPVRGNGTIDEEETRIVEGIASWMSTNSECIYGTRPWLVLGEGPALEAAAPLKDQGFNEGKGKPFGSKDVRYTQKGHLLYAIVLAWPEEGKVLLHSLAPGKGYYKEKVQRVELLGAGPLQFRQTTEGLEVDFPGQKPNEYAYALKIISNA